MQRSVTSKNLWHANVCDKQRIKICDMHRYVASKDLLHAKICDMQRSVTSKNLWHANVCDKQRIKICDMQRSVTCEHLWHAKIDDIHSQDGAKISHPTRSIRWTVRMTAWKANRYPILAWIDQRIRGLPQTDLRHLHHVRSCCYGWRKENNFGINILLRIPS